MADTIVNGTADITRYVVMRDATTKAPKADVTVTDIDLYYQEQGAAQSAKADVTALDAANSAHADNKAYHCGNAEYRVDWPDAAFDGGAGKIVDLIYVCSGCETVYERIHLVSATRGLAGTALPDAAADAPGGVPISDAGGLDLDTYIKRLEAAFTSTIAGYLDAAISTRAKEAGGALAGLATTVGVAGAGLTAITGATLAAAYDAAKTAAQAGDEMDLIDAPNATAVTAIQNGLATAAKLLAYVKSILRKDQAADADIAGTYDATTDSLQAIRDTEPMGTAMRGTDGASTYAGGDTAGTTTLLTRIVGTLLAGNHTAQTGDAYARLGAPAGASVSADIAALRDPAIKRNTALAGFQFFMALASDHVSGATGLTITATRSLDGAAFAACANAASELAGGWYKIDLAATDLNGDTVALRFTAATADETGFTIVTTS